MTETPWPTEIRYDRAARLLCVRFDDGSACDLPAELLRVESPSAEVRGHGGADKAIVPGKAGVAIERIAPVGNYAVRIAFDDGHDSGIYSWAYLHELGRDQQTVWRTYLDALKARGLKREA